MIPDTKSKYFEEKEKKPPNFPDLIPPFSGFFEDNLRFYLEVPEKKCCADAYFFVNGDKNRWHLLESKSKSHLLSAIQQLEETLQKIDEKKHPIHRIWICYKRLDVMMQHKFKCKFDPKDRHSELKILYHATGKPFLLKKTHKIYMHKVI